MSELKQLVTRYFQEHPESRDEVLKAWYAYHAPHFRVMPDMPLHNFTSSLRESKCVWCARSRELVRHDEESPQCSKRPVIREIKDILHEEACKAFALQNKAKTHALKLLAKLGMSGKTLAILHHTHGYDPETVILALDITHPKLAITVKSLLPEYEHEMQHEQAQSRAAQVKEVIVCN